MAAPALAAWVLGVLAAAGAALAVALLLGWPAKAMALVERHLFPDANQLLLSNGRSAGGSGAAAGGRSVYRVCAFGDSLTEGFTQGGQDFHPYISKLGDSLYPLLQPKGWHLEVEEQGESGERVLMGMNHRLVRTLDEHAAAGRRYDWVLLLGGINDLGGDDSTAEEVMAGLMVLVEACLAHGAHVVLMTVMEVADAVPRVEEQRLKLNQLIAQYVQDGKWAAAAAVAADGGGSQARPPPPPAAAAASNSSGVSQTPVQRRGAPRVVLFDLAAGLTWSGMSEEERWEYWDDGVHLTREGYSHMGGLIAAALNPLVQQELAATANGDGAAADAGGKKKL